MSVWNVKFVLPVWGGFKFYIDLNGKVRSFFAEDEQDLVGLFVSDRVLSKAIDCNYDILEKAAIEAPIVPFLIDADLFLSVTTEYIEADVIEEVSEDMNICQEEETLQSLSAQETPDAILKLSVVTEQCLFSIPEARLEDKVDLEVVVDVNKKEIMSKYFEEVRQGGLFQLYERYLNKFGHMTDVDCFSRYIASFFVTRLSEEGKFYKIYTPSRFIEVKKGDVGMCSLFARYVLLWCDFFKERLKKEGSAFLYGFYCVLLNRYVRGFKMKVALDIRYPRSHYYRYLERNCNGLGYDVKLNSFPVVKRRKLDIGSFIYYRTPPLYYLMEEWMYGGSMLISYCLRHELFVKSTGYVKFRRKSYYLQKQLESYYYCRRVNDERDVICVSLTGEVENKEMYNVMESPRDKDT